MARALLLELAVIGAGDLLCQSVNGITHIKEMAICRIGDSVLPLPSSSFTSKSPVRLVISQVLCDSSRNTQKTDKHRSSVKSITAVARASPLRRKPDPELTLDLA